MDIYNLIARGAVKSVQRGVVQPTSTNTPIQVTISPVNPNKSIILTNTASASYSICYGYFVSNDVVAIGGYTNASVYWQIVEFN